MNRCQTRRIQPFLRSPTASPRQFFLLLALLLPVCLPACAPLSPEDGGGGGPGGSTTDKFKVRVWELRDGVPFEPIPVAEVSVDFVDQDHLDPETNAQIVRSHRLGHTNASGYWEVTVTYNGAGEFAADKVIFRVNHVRFYAFGNTVPIENHLAEGHAELVRRPTQ